MPKEQEGEQQPEVGQLWGKLGFANPVAQT